MHDDIAYLSAQSLITGFHSKEFSPLEVMRALVDRAQALSPTVNALADCHYEEALSQARLAEARYQSKGAAPRPLEGLALVVKETSAIAGRRTTRASLIHENDIAQSTDPGVARLLEAGAILLARTTSPEFAWLFACHSRRWGITRNPWRLDISPGGSSGGAAAALAAGIAPLATGGDSTGSIRQPAGQCGIVGYKPPYGRIPLTAPTAFDPYQQSGPMTRSVGDNALMTNIMAGPHTLDHHSLPASDPLALQAKDISGLRIAVSLDLGHFEIDPCVARETHASLTRLRELGAIVEEVDTGDLSEAVRLAHGAEEFIFSGVIEKALAQHPDKVSDYVPQLAATARSFSADDYRRSLTLAGEVWAGVFGPLFEKFDLFICPSVSCPEVPADNWQRDEILVNGKALTDTDTAMTALFNMFSRCPVLALPSGFTDRGLPTGLQFVGRPHDDATLFKAALAFEAAAPWYEGDALRPNWSGTTASPPEPRKRH